MQDLIVETQLLNVAVRVGGLERGPVALLLHGWPDDVSTWDDVLPMLHAAGIRTVAPSLRGFGHTRFRDASFPRTGNSAVLALDSIALIDALDIQHCSVVGHDWGSNAAEAMVVGWPDRVQRLALLSTPPRLGGMPTSPFRQAQRQWYHWFMATARGAEAVRADPKGFARVMWENWAPDGWFDDATFEAVARSWEHPDWVDVTLHSYRARWNEVDPDESSIWLEEKVKATKTLPLPTLYFQGALDGVNPPSVSEGISDKFTGPIERIVLRGVGHFPTREAPREVGTRLATFLRPD
ncbi:alpha/beta fold hydrolase [Lichenicoccus roseus]|uniref:Alpha/beta hydrolase n=1 Tax=Lichenicoccus roseus TaxID=2683649 RepID=A0A5R9J565_9PROT|nr:alpha/beta hydrolase [Lichenicoccus roseus]TLU70486.1 alpha/beta hydrolase [Lichenicoccus roseus]